MFYGFFSGTDIDGNIGNGILVAISNPPEMSLLWGMPKIRFANSRRSKIHVYRYH